MCNTRKILCYYKLSSVFHASIKTAAAEEERIVLNL